MASWYSINKVSANRFSFRRGPRISGFAKMLEQLSIKPAKLMAILAGLAKFGSGILMILGFLTPLAALALIGVMIVAVLTMHLKNGFFVTNGGYEFNLALAGMALTLLIIGAGAYSLDSVLGIFW